MWGQFGLLSCCSITYESCGKFVCLICGIVTAHPGSAGEQPALTPRKLTLMNTTTQSVIQDLSFPSSVLAVRVNRKRLQLILIESVLVQYCLIFARVAVSDRARRQGVLMMIAGLQVDSSS